MKRGAAVYSTEMADVSLQCERSTKINNLPMKMCMNVFYDGVLLDTLSCHHKAMFKNYQCHKD